MDGGYVFENKYDWALDKFSMEIFEEEVLGIKPKPICIIKLSYKEMGEIYNSAIERYDAQLYDHPLSARGGDGRVPVQDAGDEPDRRASFLRPALY